MASAGLICQGEAGRRYRLVRPLGTVRGKSCNVWLGLDDSKPDAEYIMKRPLADQNEESWSGALSAFKHELEMQRLFAKDPMIRKLVDYVPESEPSGLMMVLEAFTDSLWDARNVRPFTTKEIKWIMKGVLLGIFTVHMKGLVYTDLKSRMLHLGVLIPRSRMRMSAIWLSDLQIVVLLANHLPERSLLSHIEVLKFTLENHGLRLAQLLQAQVDFKSPGMYDSIQTGTLAEKGNVIRDQLAIDFDLSSVPFYAEDEQCAKFLPTPQPEEAYMWANTMIEKGVSGEDIQFLVEVLNPDPNARLTVREILESGYLEV
ncbi:hypothetical protein M747DRAFT_356986 [Aspergillus niger ATCC 13496]|uniref:Protein kinase domain-containing protein n=1 Tax=Aspergillus niger ATCC 13496 TaxID=1353008 RepID=A0A370BRQ1_ASPNG|nr:hypothetical protein ANI_1_1820104 [Aspergillus niger CBS 513.88]RDH17078.1 hypothetical protein M747DRAFT_356986 [Aspergillus niger ATCC 13496]|eukprot:XP_001395583.2 hypothetical protein ANI_1_1820104 [Aspergillus niger CBS 513.88]